MTFTVPVLYSELRNPCSGCYPVSLLCVLALVCISCFSIDPNSQHSYVALVA